jgi:hypothetical protein
MRAQVIALDSVSRTDMQAVAIDRDLRAFGKALAAVKYLNTLSMRDTITAVENWLAADLLTEGECNALFQYFGWERRR